MNSCVNVRALPQLIGPSAPTFIEDKQRYLPYGNEVMAECIVEHRKGGDDDSFQELLMVNLPLYL